MMEPRIAKTITARQRWRSKLMDAMRDLLLTPGVHKKFEMANGEAAIPASWSHDTGEGLRRRTLGAL